MHNENSIGLVLARICRCQRHLTHGCMAHIGLYRGQQWILRSLWEAPGCTQSELARRIGVKPATITHALQSMERNGLVERRPDSNDQRALRVYPTDKSRALRDQIEAQWGRLESQAFAGFDARELDRLKGYLERVLQNMEAI